MSNIFISYSHQDEGLRNTLEKHLSALKRQGFLTVWHDRRINAGDELHGEISANLEIADIILLLVSADFLASDYCYDLEMKRAIERHQSGEARVIPVILRPCDWHDTPFGGLVAAPTDGKPVTTWPNPDEAFLDIVRAIKAVSSKETNVPLTKRADQTVLPGSERSVIAPRSSNLRLKKQFSQADQDDFLEKSFQYIVKFFEGSLAEIQERDSDVTGRLKQIDANRFTATLYRAGQKVAGCKIVLGGMFGRGISYSNNDQASDNSFNENISIKFDDQDLFFEAMGMPMLGGAREAKLSQEGAAEYYWSMFIRAAQ